VTGGDGRGIESASAVRDLHKQTAVHPFLQSDPCVRGAGMLGAGLPGLDKKATFERRAESCGGCISHALALLSAL